MRQGPANVFLDTYDGGGITAQCQKILFALWGGAPNTHTPAHTTVPHRPAKVFSDTYDGGVSTAESSSGLSCQQNSEGAVGQLFRPTHPTARAGAPPGRGAQDHADAVGEGPVGHSGVPLGRRGWIRPPLRHIISHQLAGGLTPGHKKCARGLGLSWSGWRTENHLLGHPLEPRRW